MAYSQSYDTEVDHSKYLNEMVESKDLSSIFVIHAYRWGDRENHSYQAGIAISEDTALDLAKETQERRGGKYECEVIEWRLDGSRKRVVLNLPKVPPDSLPNGF